MAGPDALTDAGGSGRTLREIVAAQVDPFRSRLLVILSTAGPLGADELALRAGEPVQKVRRHLNALCGQGLTRVSEEIRRRGVIKRFYVVSSDMSIDEASDEQLSETDRRRSTLGLLRLIFEEASRAAANPRLGGRSDRVTINLPAKVDDRGWRELAELHARTLERAQEIVEQSRDRLERDDAPAIGVISQQIMLEVPEHDGSAIGPTA